MPGTLETCPTEPCSTDLKVGGNDIAPSRGYGYCPSHSTCVSWAFAVGNLYLRDTDELHDGLKPFPETTMTDPQQKLEVAQKAARVGGEIVARYFRDGVEMHSKESGNLVSAADVESERAIAAVIRQHFPDHTLLGEETLDQVDGQAEHLWIIDPLDGTNNFAHQIPHFAVSIAYYERGLAQCGVIFNPIRGDWYIAERGQGAFHNGRRATASPRAALNEVLVAVGFYYNRGALMEATLRAVGDLFRQQIHGIRRFGTASLDLVSVGTGSFGAYFEYELAPWDFAAGRLFVEEAGGRTTTCRGEPLPMEKTSILATNGLLHDAVLEIVGRHFTK